MSNNESPRRRYLTFSLRTLFVVTTALAVWLGIVVNRPREQREAVKAIEAVRGLVYYDWQITDTKPGGPIWIRRLIGNEFFQKVERVILARVRYPTDDFTVQELIPHLMRLRAMRVLVIVSTLSSETADRLKVALPNCEVVLYSVMAD